MSKDLDASVALKDVGFSVVLVGASASSIGDNQESGGGVRCPKASKVVLGSVNTHNPIADCLVGSQSHGHERALMAMDIAETI